MTVQYSSHMQTLKSLLPELKTDSFTSSVPTISQQLWPLTSASGLKTSRLCLVTSFIDRETNSFSIHYSNGLWIPSLNTSSSNRQMKPSGDSLSWKHIHNMSHVIIIPLEVTSKVTLRFIHVHTADEYSVKSQSLQSLVIYMRQTELKCELNQSKILKLNSIQLKINQNKMLVCADFMIYI